MTPRRASNPGLVTSKKEYSHGYQYPNELRSTLGPEEPRQNQKLLAGSFQRLSSGYRVNSAADDAAGLAISESMKSQIRSYTVAQRNASDAQSMAQTAEGALGDVHDIMGRMRELAMQSSNGDLGSTDRGYINTEFKALQNEVTRIQGSAKFNGKQLINATAGDDHVPGRSEQHGFRPDRGHLRRRQADRRSLRTPRT